jgi:O-antigen/teichoic acid export membrane protein
MLTMMASSRVVGWYGAATTLFQTLMFVAVLTSTAWLPRLVAAFEISKQELFRVARVPVAMVFVASVPLAAGTALLASPVVHAFYGARYEHAIPVLIVLAACLPWIYLNIMLYAMLVAMKRAKVWTIVMVGAAIINPLFNLALIPATQSRFHNGAIGAAASLVLTELIMDMIGITLVGRELFTARDLRRWGAALAASAAMLVVAYLLRHLGQPIAIPSGILTLVALSLALRVVSPAELALVRARVIQLLGGVGIKARSKVATGRG